MNMMFSPITINYWIIYRIWIVVICCPNFVLVVKFFKSNNDITAFRILTEEFWRWRLEQVPEFATSLGVHSFDESLEHYTLEAFTHRKEKCDEFAFRLNAIDPTTLPPRDAKHLQLLRENIHTYIEGYRWSRLAPLNPLSTMEGIHKDFTFWTDQMVFEEAAHFRVYIQRMRSLATQVNEQIALMREAIRTGWMNHILSMVSVVQQVQEIIEMPAISSPFFRPFNNSMQYLGFSVNKIDRLQSAGEAVITDQVLPSYKKLKTFLEDEYLPATRHSIGIYSLSGGEQYYRDSIKWYLAEELEPIEVHKAAILGVERLRIEMDEVRQYYKYSGTLDRFIRYANTDPQYFYVTEDEILDHYVDIVKKKIPSRIGWIFKNITTLPLEVQKMPFDGPSAIAMPPSDDLSMPGVLFINVRKPHKRPKWQMMSLALRETYPGHHFQTSYTRNQSVPKYLRTQEFRKMHSVPFQFPFHSAFIRGWSLYAGGLGNELSLYSDPMEKFGQFYIELLSLVKASVDTGIHAFGWSREHSIQYITTNTGLPRHLVEEQIDTIITLPGQALSEPFGLQKLRQLRNRAELLLGPQFSLAEFHHRVLEQGPVSLQAVERNVNMWLSSLVPRFQPRSNCHPGLNSNVHVYFTMIIVLLVYLEKSFSVNVLTCLAR